MKKKLYFVSGASYWNRLLRKFQNLYGRIKSSVFHKNYTLQQQTAMLRKLNQIFARLQKMQHKVGIKIAETALAFMLISATSFAQNFQFQGNIIAQNEQDIVVGRLSYPVFADIDKDGDLDLYVGNDDGNIQVFTNDGSENFTLAGNLKADGADIDVGDFSDPVFADLDKDGDLDLYVGNNVGNIQVFINGGSGNFSSAGNLQADAADIDVGTYSLPAFADLDGDGNLDLYVGNFVGNIQVFTNDGTNFTLTDTLQADGADIVGGYSSPVFEDLDKDDDLDLYVGQYNGIIKVFTNDGTNFTLTDTLQADGADIDVGYSSNPVFADLDKDGDLDLYVGSQHGTIEVFTNDGSGNFTAAADLRAKRTDIAAGYYSSPAFADLDGDGNSDLYVGNYAGNIRVFTNDGSGNFSVADTLQADGADIDVGRYSSPTFEDIDGDGNLDLYVGNGDGYIQVFTNAGNGNFTSAGNLQADGADIDVGNYSSPAFADLDGDGNSDLFVGDYYGYIQVFTNVGNGIFTAADTLQADGADIAVGYYSSPVFADLDNDGDLDLYVGNGAGYIQVFTNVGNGIFTAADTLQADGADIDVDYYSSPIFEDIDKDGDLDLFVGTFKGKIAYYKNMGVSSLNQIPNKVSDQISVYPNPSSDFITVSNEKLNIKKIEISDLTGKIIYHSTLNSLQTKIDLSKQQSGVYFIKIQTDNQIFTKKIIKN